MNKTIFTTAIVVALTVSTPILASDDNAVAVVRASSDLIYRGQDVTGSQGTIGLGLSFSDVVLDGVFVSADMDTVEVTPANDNTSIRSDIRVGYQGNLANFEYSAELARVLNPVTYTSDYTEVRLKTNYSIAYAELAHGISNNINRDTYFSLGVEGRPLSSNQNLLVGASASVVNYDTATFGQSNVEFNNAQVYATYDVWRELDVTAGFSYGGGTPSYDLGNHAWVGASYSF